MSERPDASVLLAESRWLTALARRLVDDGLDAEELAQETLVRALERPPRASGSLRGWLATVLRRRVVDRRREERFRAARERAVSRGESTPSTLDVVAKAEVQRELVEALLALEEPYRETLLLRFFEGLPPRVIAARTGAAVATVDSRIQRGLEKLRARLARGRGRTDWLAGLAPLAFAKAPRPFWPGGVSIVSMATKSALVAAAVVAVGVWWWSGGERVEHASVPTEGAVVGAVSDARDVAPAGSALGGAAPASDAREAQHASSTAPASSAPAPEEPRPLVRGRVIDVGGRALAGVLLGWEERDARGAHELGESDGRGRFELEVPPSAETIVALDRRWSTVLAGSARTSAGSEACVVVARRGELTGHVVAADGGPIAQAEVSVRMGSQLGADLGAELGIVLDHSVRRAWRARTDELGRFAIADVPCVDGAEIGARAGGFQASTQKLECAGAAVVTLVLERSESDTLVRGVVLDPAGAPVAGARVGCGGDVVVTDVRGRFELHVGAVARRLVATARGFQACVREPEVAADGTRGWPAHVVLQLPGSALSIAGRVLDQARRPLVGAHVWLFDPTPVGRQYGEVLLAESVAQRDGGPLWNFVLSDASGRFVLEGLWERVYEIHALDPRTLASDAARARGGEQEVEIRFGGTLHERVHGRVVARDGTGIGGVRVELRRLVLQASVGAGDGKREEWMRSGAVVTGADGVFEFRDVPRIDIHVCAWGDAILPVKRDVTSDVDVEHFDVVVERLVRLQVELDAPYERADSVRVFDADGERMVLRVMRGELPITEDFAALEDGRTQVLSIGEGAREIVFFRGTEEVGRVKVAPAVEGIHRVRW